MFVINVNLIFNIVLVTLIILLLILLLETIDTHKKKQRMFGIDNAYMESKDFVRNNKFFRNYYNSILIVMVERKKEKYAPFIFYGAMLFSLICIIFFINIKQILFAVTVPIIFNLVVRKIFILLKSDSNEKIEEQLPFVIDTIIKVFSKYSDLKSVIYETSFSIDEPMRSKFEKLSRKMISENHEKAMMDFAKELDSIWIYSLVFILLSYKEEAKKEDVIINLRHLGNIIERENNLKNASVTDKQYGVILNYVIAALGAIAGISHIVLNPVAEDFFFGSFAGLISFSIGYAAVVLTILVNIKMSSKKRRGK